MIEFALSLLFIIPVLFGLVDMSLMLVNYAKIEQAVREGARTASRLPLLFESAGNRFENVDSPTNLITCEQSGVDLPNGECEHVLIHSRARAIIRHENLFGMPLEIDNPDGSGTLIPGINISSQFFPSTGAGLGGEDTIEVEISSEYDGFFGTWPLTANYQAPWLYQDVPVGGT